MQIKTHLAIAIFGALFFISHVTHKVIFVVALLVASLLPAADSGFLSLVSSKNSRPIKSKSGRGIFHSFTLCILISIFLAFYLPVLAFPFFLGYGLHLFADAWTVEGIRPFWPNKTVANGRIRTGSSIEETVFLTFAILDVIFLALLFI